jgi:hypothetical protein
LVGFNGENALRTRFYADAAGNTLTGKGILLQQDHNMKGAGFYAFAAFLTFVFGYCIYPRFILGNGAGFAGFRAFAALSAGINLQFSVFLRHVQTGYIFFAGILFFVKSSRASKLAGKTVHTGVTV